MNLIHALTLEEKNGPWGRQIRFNLITLNGTYKCDSKVYILELSSLTILIQAICRLFQALFASNISVDFYSGFLHCT
jgi:hypothetical protein